MEQARATASTGLAILVAPRANAYTQNMGREKGHPDRQTDRQTDRQATIAIKQEQMGMSFLNTETPAG